MNNPVRHPGNGMNVNKVPFNCPPQHRQCTPHPPHMNSWNPRGQGPRGNPPPGPYKQGQKFKQQNNNKQKKNKVRR